MNVYLIGMPGSGKSEVGALVAPILGLGFADLDALIETEAQVDVAQVFRTEGELGFRRRERAALRDAADRGELVVACGGGTVIDEENRSVMRDSGTIVLLSVPAGTLVDRIDFDGSRPLLSGPEDVERLLAERDYEYRASADVVVDGSGAPDAVAAAVAEAVRA